MLQISEWHCRENVVLYVKSDIIQMVSANVEGNKCLEYTMHVFKKLVEVIMGHHGLHKVAC